MLTVWGLVCLMASSALAAAPASGLDQPTTKLVRTLSADRHDAYGKAMLLDSASRAASLTALEVQGVDVVIHLSGAPAYRSFVSEDGAKVVVDLGNTLNLATQKPVRVDDGLISGIRTSNFATDPQFVSRVVIDCAAPCAYRIVSEDGLLRVTVSETSSEPGSRSAETVLAELRNSLRFEENLFAEMSRRGDFLALQMAGAVGDYRSSRSELVSSFCALADSATLWLDKCAAELDSLSGAALAADGATRLSGLAALNSRQARLLSGTLDRAGTELPFAAQRTRFAATVAALEQDLANLPVEEAPLAPTTESATILTVVDAPVVVAETPSRPLKLLYQEAKEQEAAARISALATDLERVQAVHLAMDVREGEALAALDGDEAATEAPAPGDEMVVAEATEEAPVADEMAGEEAPAVADEAASEETPPVVNKMKDLLKNLATEEEAGDVAATGDASEEPVSDEVALDEAVEADAAEMEEAAESAVEAATEIPVEEVEPAPMEVIEAETVMAEEPVVEQRIGGTSVMEGEPEAEPAVRMTKEERLHQLVTIDFRGMELTNVVDLLARKAQINVVAGTDVSGTISASLTAVPLMQAMETILRLENLGLVEEEGIYRIVPYDDAVAARRETQAIRLETAQAEEVKKTLDDVIAGHPDAPMVSISASNSTNVVIISGPEDRVAELAMLVAELDVAEPTLPTVTKVFKLNYAKPSEVEDTVKSMLTTQGKLAKDDRARQIVVTDIPVVMDELSRLLKEIDLPVRQVTIESMIVDAILTDDAETGVDWLMSAIRRKNTQGQTVGTLQNLSTGVQFDPGDLASGLTFGLLTDNIALDAVISAEVRSGNAKLLANPVVTTIENAESDIEIGQEIPYRELTESEAGGALTSTKFKSIGTKLSVTPRVTHDNHIIVSLTTSQSDTKGEFDGVPIEDKRATGTTLIAQDGQTIFIGGLRSYEDEHTIDKVPVLGDIPVMNFMFKHSVVRKRSTELLIFLTCHVLEEGLPELTPSEQMDYDELGSVPLVPDAQRRLFQEFEDPSIMREPPWKWRRAK